MNNTKYSLTTLLNDLLKLQNNGYQIITKLSEVVSSNAETVEIPVNIGNSIQTVIVPSFGSLKNQMTSIENNIKSLSGIGDVDSSIRLSDGTFRKILVSNLQREADDIKSMIAPTQFATKENWFFESFLNPLLYIKFNLENQIKSNTEEVEVSRYILNLNSPEKIRIFNDNFKDKENLSFARFSKILLDNNISYFLDREITRLPPRNLRYWGNFAVTKIVEDTQQEIIDDIDVNKRSLRIKLDSLNYNDSLSEYLGTQSLKIGDFLVVNGERKNTRYVISAIQSEERSVTLRLVEGFDPIKIGVDSLSFYSVNDAPVSVDVNIGFNEHCVIFIRPIDPNSKIASVNLSPGVALYTNDLTTKTQKGETISLSQFYQNEVVDFGAYIYSLTKEGIIPSTLGLFPDAPILKDFDFKVVQINRHATDSPAVTNLKKLQSDKLRVQSNIDTLNKSIQDLRFKIQTTRYSSTQLKESDNIELNRLIEEKTSQSNLYSSIIDDINKIATDSSVESLSPKYRIRGFFPMPLPKVSNRTAPQEVVQFTIQYRYLSKDGSSNKPEQLDFIDVDGQTRRGTFSNWIEIKSELRARKLNEDTGNYSWITEDVENGEAININSVDIPISKGESVEFRIKSISESGWPISPKESEWSDVIKIEFPSELESNSDISSILEEAKSEKVRVELQSEINLLGIPRHLSNSIEQNERFFAHPAQEISSGFLSNEQNIISLFDKLVAMDNEIAQLRSLIESARGILSVRLIDERGTEYEIEPNTTLKLFAGNYRDEVSSLEIKKGVIITKNYFIKIYNESASNLELYARFWGSRRKEAQKSFSGGEGFNQADEDYNTTRKYDFVPIGLSNADISDISDFGFIRNLPEAASQVHGQFIQSRYKSIDGTKNLYSTIDGSFVKSSKDPSDNASSLNDLERTLDKVLQDEIATGSTGNTTEDFIWHGTDFNVINATEPVVQNAYEDSILVHIKHPDISNWIESADPIETASKEIRNSILANKQASEPNGLLQTALFYEGTGTVADRRNKVSFDSNDQYLIGPLSVGAYLFLNPNSHNDLVVDGSDSLSFRTVTFGDASSLTIPVTFQYRMTDYFGIGDSGIGNVGGKLTSNASTNLTYTKTIGIDIYSNPINKERFSFDIEITARYFSKSRITRDIPSRSFESVIDDLNSTIKVITPNTSRGRFLERRREKKKARRDSNRT